WPAATTGPGGGGPRPRRLSAAGVPAAVVVGDRHGVRPGGGAIAGPRALRADAVRPGVPAGAATGRGRRADDQRSLLPHGDRLVGPARQALQHDEAVAVPDLRPGLRGPGGGPARPGVAATDAGAGERGVRPHAEDQQGGGAGPLAVGVLAG